jgi:hypothetical protein
MPPRLRDRLGERDGLGHRLLRPAPAQPPQHVADHHEHRDHEDRARDHVHLRRHGDARGTPDEQRERRGRAQSGKHVDSNVAEQLIADATAIIDAIGCSTNQNPNPNACGAATEPPAGSSSAPTVATESRYATGG